MQTSTHYGFNLPEADDFVNIEDLTNNWSSLDNILYNSGTKSVVCSTAAATAAKTASTSGGDFEKRSGAQIIVKFTNGNTASDPTLNVDNTGAAPIYVNGEATEKLPADGVFLFVYNGTQFELVGGISSGAGGGSMIVITDTTSEHEFEGDTVTATVGAYSESAVVSNGTATITGFMETGTVTITATDFSQTISITNYNKYTVSLVKPFGDMYVDWLDSIDESSASYSSLADVLADEKMVRELFTRHASVDFLVSNVGNYPEELETIINNDYCAKWINLRDYALDTLYANNNNNIAYLMNNADKYFYGEWTIVDGTPTSPTWGPKGNVPIMTSNTAPYGTASAYQVFDGTTSVTNGTDFSYRFETAICVRKFYCNITGGTLQASNDGSAWIDISDPFTNYNYYIYYRVHFSSSKTVREVQFYGRELKPSIPLMVNNTEPYGEAFGYKLYNSSTNYYGLFSSSAPVNVGGYIGYDFGKQVSFSSKNTFIRFVNMSSSDRITCNVQYSNDKNTWTDVFSSTLSVANKTIVNLPLPDDLSFRYIRFNLLTTTGATAYLAGFNLYTINYSECEWDEEHPRHYIYDHGIELEEINDMPVGGTITKKDYEIVTETSGTSGFGIHSQVYTNLNITNYVSERVILGDMLKDGSSNDPKNLISVFNQEPPVAAYSDSMQDGFKGIGSNAMANTYLNPNNCCLNISNITGIKYPTVGSFYYTGQKFTISEWWLE